jgi:hypothetical protein
MGEDIRIEEIISDRKNAPKDLMTFFSVPRKGICNEPSSDGKVTMPEYRDFWSSLSESEKAYYRQVELV